MKKIISLVLALSMIFSCCALLSGVSFAEEETEKILKDTRSNFSYMGKFIVLTISFKENENINKADYKYIDAILTNWNKENLHSLKDIDAKAPAKKVNKQRYDKPTSKFFNFESHDYDYDDLEKKLLGWDDND